MAVTSPGGKPPDPSAEEQFRHLRTLRRRLILLLILASLLPLAFVSVSTWIVLGGIISAKSDEHMQTIVRDHAATVDLFLQERLIALDLVARPFRREQITDPAVLRQVFQNLNRGYTDSFLDLGVIAQDGRHLAYVGPHDLLGRNYRGASWFEHVSQEGTYISNVFLGFRQAPHFIMAVRMSEDAGFWILRATVNSEVFSNLVSKGRLGRTGDCFIVDRQGRYQTLPRGGARVLDPGGLDLPPPHEALSTRPAVTLDGRRVTRTMQWIKKGDWLLVAQQDQAEAGAPFREAMTKGMATFAAGVVILFLSALFSTRLLFRMIERTTEQKESLNAQLLQAGKLASLGEMSTGLAHEINNPLAIIATEQTNVSDLLSAIRPKGPEVEEMLQSVAMTQKQVMRCKEITQKMLQFGRQQKTAGQTLNPGPQLAEIVNLMKQQARVNNVDICLEAEDPLPAITINPTELQQLAVNIIKNAVEAIPSRGAIVVSAWSGGGRFHLTIEDTGPGIPAEIRDKIFEPFFTTKPVGKGTGLGLSVCYGIAAKWRGQIRVESRPGGGALFDVEFPAAAEAPAGS